MLLKKNQICGICYKVQDIVQIECGHTYCKFCLKQIFFKQGEIDLDNFRCPLDKCRRILTEKSLNLFIDDFQTKYEQYLKQGVLFGLKDNEKMITCLNKMCNSQFVIWKDADTFKCQYCKQEYCLKCKLQKHDGFNCIQALRLNQVTKTRIAFLESIKVSQTQQICPNCLTVVEKIKGCNFMTCASKSCKSKKYFCFKCGEPLQFSDSTNHFENGDPYDGRCNIKVNGKWFEAKKLPQNNIPCPNCQSVDPLKSKIEGNLILCNSVKCSDKIYCHTCKIELDNNTILNHLGAPNTHSIKQNRFLSPIFKLIFK